jgi:neutral ceramidase
MNRLFSTLVLGFTMGSALPAHANWRAGAAKVNITPSYPVRLSGYGSRTKEHEGVKVDIWVKALAMAWNDDAPAVVLTVDNCGVPAALRAEVLAALKTDGVSDALFAVCSTHTHCAPVLKGSLRNLFAAPLPAEHVQHVERYTQDLRDWMIKGARDAIRAMQPAKLAIGKGKVGFAVNRRSPVAGGFANRPNYDGPVDHDLPVLKVTDLQGKVLSVFTSYACHCTTMNWNNIHPDWAGMAQLHLEFAFPKAIALTAIGCGADQNPNPRQQENDVRLHGHALATEARRVVNDATTPITGPLKGGVKALSLPLAESPTKNEWLMRSSIAKSGQDRNYATHFLELLQSEQPVPTAVPYTVQGWSFGDDLAMVFLNGEVVVDYGLRLKREFDPSRFWVNSYSNDVPAYIPSERVLTEGGYEGGTAMTYYLWPNKFAPGLEDTIIRAVHDLLPPGFKAKPQKD